MKTLSQHPTRFAWIAALVVFILPFLSSRPTVDFQLHDNYFFVPPLHVGLMLAVMLLGIWLLYWFTRGLELSPWMTASHLFITVILLVAIGVAMILSPFLDLEDFQRHRQFNGFILLGFSLALLSQLLFLLNLIIALVKKFSR
jgi:hypothetical protein